MVERTASGKDIDQQKFTPYTEEYAEKKGVVRTGVDLIQSGEMITDMEKAQSQANVIKVKIDEDSVGKAHGNITGSYGRSRGDKSKARNFFGFRPDDPIIDKIVKQVADIQPSIFEDEPEDKSLISRAIDLVAIRTAMNQLGDDDGNS